MRVLFGMESSFSVCALLKTEQHEDFALPAFQRLESFSDQRAGAVDLRAADVDRLGLHGEAANVAGDEQVADPHWMRGGDDTHLDTAGRRDFCLRCASNA